MATNLQCYVGLYIACNLCLICKIFDIELFGIAVLPNSHYISLGLVANVFVANELCVWNYSKEFCLCVLLDPSVDRTVQVHTSLPPKVDGQLRCYLKLKVSHIAWLIPNSPDVTHVRVHWWGEDGPGTLFRSHCHVVKVYLYFHVYMLCIFSTL